MTSAAYPEFDARNEALRELPGLLTRLGEVAFRAGATAHMPLRFNVGSLPAFMAWADALHGFINPAVFETKTGERYRELVCSAGQFRVTVTLVLGEGEQAA